MSDAQSTDPGATKRERLAQEAANCGIPGYMIPGLVRYIHDRIPPGDFLRYVLENNLMMAAGHADDTNRRLLHAYCSFIYNYAPITSHGSPERVSAWLGEGGSYD